MASKQLRDAVDEYGKYIKANGVDGKILNALELAVRVAEQEGDVEYGKKISQKTKNIIENYVKNSTGVDIFGLEIFAFENQQSYEILDLYYQFLLFEAQNKNLDSYLLYLERYRPPKERFYAPKRKQLLKLGLIQALQDMLDDKLDILTISMPPGTGKTTLEKFFNSGVMGWFPNDYSLFFSHSGDITRMYYDGVLNILTDSEYAWKEIFPKSKVTNTNAKMEQINVDKYKPFPSLQTTSRGSNNSGKVRASKFLMVDDLIGGIEEAMNKNQLDKLWNVYSVDARQRKVQDTDGKPCKEIHIATRWSVHDVIGRLERLYEGNPRFRSVAVPCIDEKAKTSNFDYMFGGFTYEFFLDQKQAMDDVSFRCLYMNEPIEREGLLYNENDLREFFELPSEEPDAILGVCDTKTRGVDFMVLPVFYQYGDDFYLVDCICDDSSDFDRQERRITDILLRHNVQQCEFESNAGGDRLAYNIDARLKVLKGRCNITTKPTETHKETRIIVNSDWVMKHCLFKGKEMYEYGSDYERFMAQMTTYSVAGKNKHDDVVDALANFSLFITKKERLRKTVILQNFL